MFSAACNYRYNHRHLLQPEEVLPEFVEFCKGAVLVAHNANFDMSFINENIRRQKIKEIYTYIDTLGLARVLLPGQAKHTLDAVCKTLKISLENHLMIV